MDNTNAGANSNGGEGRGDRPAWMDSLPDAHKNNERFMAFKEPANAWDKFDSFLQAEGNTVVIPGDDATDEERKSFYSKLGVPESPDKYEFDPVDIDAEADKMFRQVMLESDITKRQAKGVRKAFVDMLQRGKEAQAKARADQEKAEQDALDASVNTLKDNWKGDTFKVNTELAKRAFKSVAQWAGVSESEAGSFIEQTKIGNLTLGDHPLMIRLFHAISSKISDDSMAGSRGASSGQLSDEDKAKSRFPNTKWR